MINLLVYLSIREHMSGTAGPIFANFFVQIPCAMAQSSSGGVAIHYISPVLRMTSRLAIVGRMSMHRLSVTKYSAPCGVARLGQSLMSMNALFASEMLPASSMH